MYNPQITVDRIKKESKDKNIPLSELNSSCALNKNTISSSAVSKMGLSAKILFDISNYLDCSVDYLLGRTDNPSVSQISISETVSDSGKLLSDFIRIFENLSTEDKIKVMNYVVELN